MYKSLPQLYKAFLSPQKRPLYPTVEIFLIRTPGNHWSVFCHHRFNVSFPECHVNGGMRVLLCLASFTQYHGVVCLRSICVTESILPFHWWGMPHCTGMAHSLSTQLLMGTGVSGLWILWLKLLWTHLCTSPCVNTGFHFSWVNTCEGWWLIILNSMCQLDWPQRAQINHHFWTLSELFLHEISIGVAGLSQEGCPPPGGQASADPLRAWTEQEEEKEGFSPFFYLPLWAGTPHLISPGLDCHLFPWFSGLWTQTELHHWLSWVSSLPGWGGFWTSITVWANSS